MNGSAKSYINYAISGIIESIEESVWEDAENGQKITKDHIESKVDSVIETALSGIEYHIFQALKILVEEEISHEDIIAQHEEQ